MPQADHVGACLSDFHSGHSLGLLNPDTVIVREGQDPKRFVLGTTQEYIWSDIYVDCINRLETLAEERPVTVFLNGDITHGTRYLEAVFAPSIADQVQIAKWCLLEILRRRKLHVRHIRFLLGTAAHTLDGSTEQLLCDQLAAEYPQINIGVCGHGLYNVGVGDVEIDVAHHGPGVGTRQWTQPNTARAYCLSLMMGCIARGQEPPAVVLRSHRHRCLSSDGGYETVRYAGRETHMIVTPGLCGMNGHGQQVTQSLGEQDHGIFAFLIGNKKVEVIPMVKTIDLRRKERLV